MFWTAKNISQEHEPALAPPPSHIEYSHCRDGNTKRDSTHKIHVVIINSK